MVSKHLCIIFLIVFSELKHVYLNLLHFKKYFQIQFAKQYITILKIINLAQDNSIKHEEPNQTHLKWVYTKLAHVV